MTNCGRSSVSDSSYFIYWDRIFNISTCMCVYVSEKNISTCMCMCPKKPKTLLTCREKTADGIVFKLGIYIHYTSELTLFMFSRRKSHRRTRGKGPYPLRSGRSSSVNFWARVLKFCMCVKEVKRVCHVTSVETWVRACMSNYGNKNGRKTTFQNEKF